MKSDKTKARENTRIALSLINPLKRTKVNSIRTSKANSDSHEEMKFKICRQLVKEGKDFLTEVEFLNGKKCDILSLSELKVIEVLASESLEKCKEKVKEYPKEFEVIFVKSDQEWNDKLIY